MDRRKDGEREKERDGGMDRWRKRERVTEGSRDGERERE